MEDQVLLGRITMIGQMPYGCYSSEVRGVAYEY
jgi:hypothetical protein